MKRATARKTANPMPANGRAPHGPVVALAPILALERAARAPAGAADRCAKCHSTFIGREPAFIHCYYCGKMARIPNGSLLAQEEFELRSGLRVAS